jgi:hypothetical protein
VRGCTSTDPGSTWPRRSPESLKNPNATRVNETGCEAVFVCGHDDLDLLKLALPDGGPAAIAARVAVEVQTKCANPYHDDGPHVCEIDGTAVGAEKNGGLRVIPRRMYDAVTVPQTYLVGLTVTR